MSRSSMDSVGSVSGPGWSCNTLNEGVTMAANLAGMTIQPDQVDEVWIVSSKFIDNRVLPFKSLYVYKIYYKYICIYRTIDI